MAAVTKPQDKVLLMDLDNTIIDRKTQQLNDNRFTSVIRTAQSMGWTLGLSSDTPLESLKMWSYKFGIRGPIVAEKGAIVETDGSIIYAKPRLAEAFSKSFFSVVERLSNMNMNVVFGSPVELISNGTSLGKNPEEKIVFANNLRKFSLGLFVLKTDENGHLVPNKDDTRKISEAINDVLPKSESMQKWVNPEGGLIVVSDMEINKRKGSTLLMDKLRLEQVGMVGDSRLDYIGKDIAMHYAVGNADKDFKAKSDYISPFELTSGVVDIVKGLLRD